MRRGQSKYLDADYEGAVEDFEKINDDNPYFAGAKHNNLGLCYYKRQCFDQAEEEYNKAIKYNSKSIKTVSCYNPGVLYGKESKYSIAKKFFRRCLNIDPLFPRLMKL